MSRGLLCLLAVSVGSSAWADPKVPVHVEVVEASKEPGQVDKGLEAMQAALAARQRYRSLKRLSAQTITTEAKAQTVALPNGTSAEISLESLKDGVATLRVKLPPTDTTYKLAREKSLYLQAGAHGAAELWLVLGQPK